MREDIKLEPFDQAKYEAGFQAIADEVDARVLERAVEIAKEVSPQDPAIDISTNPRGTNVWKELYDRYKEIEDNK
jgi:hypothetical protein